MGILNFCCCNFQKPITTATGQVLYTFKTCTPVLDSKPLITSHNLSYVPCYHVSWVSRLSSTILMSIGISDLPSTVLTWPHLFSCQLGYQTCLQLSSTVLMLIGGKRPVFNCPQLSSTVLIPIRIPNMLPLWVAMDRKLWANQLL